MALITVLILWTSLQILSISSEHSFREDSTFSSNSNSRNSDSRSSSSNSSFRFGFLIGFLSFSAKQYNDDSSVWAKSVYDDYEETHFSLNPEENSCSKSYSLPLNTVIGLQAVSSEECTISINTSLDSVSSFVIEIKRREGNPHYSTFFVENFLEEKSDNAANVISFPLGGCTVKLVGKSLIFHLIMTYIDVSIHNLGSITTTQEHNCGVEYNGVEWFHHKWYPFMKYDTGDRVRMWVNKFNIVCPKGCVCSLGLNQWLTNCKTNKRSTLLVCNPNIVSLSFLKRRLNKVQSEAFLCYLSLRRLTLSRNNIKILSKQTFEVLEQLTFLDISYNQIQSLPSGIFDHQSELEYLKLDNNYLSSLPSDAFSFLYRLKYVDLSFNLFKIAFKNSIFSELQSVKYLGLRNANIQLLSNKTFSFLSFLTKLDLKHNDISAFSVSNIFSDLENLTDMNLGHNKLTRIGRDVFNSTVNLLRLSLDHNYLAFLPVDVFRNLAKLEYLELSYNLFSSITVNIIFSHIPSTPAYIWSFLLWGHNKLSEIKIDTFKFAIKLTQLSLNNNELLVLRPGVFTDLENLIDLNLSHNFLSSLPDEFSIGLTNLQDLDLSNNLFTELPKISLPRLNYLYFTSNIVSSVETTYFKEFVDINHLNILDLSHNKISIFPLAIFKKLLDINRLNLAFNDITYLMSPSVHLDIWFLNLKNNRLSSLPHDIFDGFTTLFELHLQNNKLVELPDFSSVRRLDILHLSNNRLTIYPNSLRALRRIKYLSLRDNQFVYFQIKSFQFKSIRYLDFSGNKIDHLKSGLFFRCAKMRVLSAGYNKIRKLPLGIFDSCRRVVKLSLQYNNLSMLHNAVFQYMISLQLLELEGNNLVTLPSNIFTLNIKLRQLKLSWNKRFVIFPETIEPLTRLQTLELEGVNLKNVSSGIFDSCLSLQTLFMSNNHIVYLFQSTYNVTTKLRLLNLCCNNISSLPMSIFKPLFSLEYLNLAYNSLGQLPSLTSCAKLVFLEINDNMLSHSSFYNLRSLSRLKMLIMQNNNITVIPRNAFNKLTMLRIFMLYSNSIKSLDAGVFKSLKSLQILSLSKNYISNIDDSLAGLQNLTSLELQHNELTYISQSTFENLPKLIFLNISQNYIQQLYLGGIKYNFLQTIFDLRENMLSLLTAHSIPNIQVMVLVDHYSACCFMGGDVICISVIVRSDYLTCKRMLPSTVLRLTMWLVGSAAVTFNFGVICSRLFLGMKNTLQSALVLNLALSDFLMGIDILILSSADFYYHNYFPSFSASWIESSICKIAAALSTLSSEASVILVVLIGFDRYLGVRYPLSVHRGLGKTRTRLCVIICWLISMVIALTPVVVDKYAPGFYDISEVCVGLPIVKRKVTLDKDEFIPVKTFAIQHGYVYVKHNRSFNEFYSYYDDGYWRLASVSTIQEIYYRISEVSGFKLANLLSIVVFIGFNLTCFAALAVVYTRIFQVASISSTAIQSTKKNQEMRMALKMSVVVLTDFLCWVPLAFVCLFVQCGISTVGPELYSWTVGLILPINSCLNPFLYTLAVVLVNKSRKLGK